MTAPAGPRPAATVSRASDASIAAIDALGRGIANLRANAELLVVQFVTMLFVGASIAVPVFYLLREIGIPPSLLFESDPTKMQAAIAGLDVDPTAILSLLGTGLVVTLVGGTILFVVYCYAQAGVLAVLAAGDAQAPSVRGAPVEVFRAFSWRGWASWSFRWGWRYFWLVNLYLLVVTVALFVPILPLAFLGRGLDESNAGAACLVACGIAVPLFALFFVLWIGLQVSGAVMVVEDAGVGRAMRRGLSLTGRRLWGLLLLVLLLVCASMALGMAAFAVELAVGALLTEGSLARTAVTGGIEVLKFLLSTVVSLAFTAALIAIVRGETRADRRAAEGGAAR